MLDDAEVGDLASTGMSSKWSLTPSVVVAWFAWCCRGLEESLFVSHEEESTVSLFSLSQHSSKSFCRKLQEIAADGHRDAVVLCPTPTPHVSAKMALGLLIQNYNRPTIEFKAIFSCLLKCFFVTFAVLAELFVVFFRFGVRLLYLCEGFCEKQLFTKTVMMRMVVLRRLGKENIVCLWPMHRPNSLSWCDCL